MRQKLSTSDSWQVASTWYVFVVVVVVPFYTSFGQKTMPSHRTVQPDGPTQQFL